MNDSKKQQAMDKALYYLGFRARSIKQMRGYLKKKDFSESIIDETIDALVGYGYLDDERLAARIVEHSSLEKGLGKQAAQNKLYRSGIDIETSKRAIDEIEPNRERENAIAWANKLWPKLSGEDPRKRKEKLFRRLISKGFGYDTLKEVLDEFGEDDASF